MFAGIGPESAEGNENKRLCPPPAGGGDAKNWLLAAFPGAAQAASWFFTNAPSFMIADM
jgi:hypothetical protein